MQEVRGKADTLCDGEQESDSASGPASSRSRPGRLPSRPSWVLDPGVGCVVDFIMTEHGGRITEHGLAWTWLDGARSSRLQLGLVLAACGGGGPGVLCVLLEPA